MSDDLVKGFIISNEAWYCQKPETHLPEDEVIIGSYCKDGSCTGEFLVEWNDIAPKLEVYSDGLETLMNTPELISTLCELETNFTVHELTEALQDIGYVDLTERSKNKTRQL